MKKTALIMAAVLVMSMISACQKDEPETPAATPESTPAAVATVEPTASPEPTETPDPVENAEPAEVVETVEDITPDVELTDNFSVDSALVEAFAKKVQAAVAAQDLEALAELSAYPLSIGSADGYVSVTSADELIALGAEKIFTPEMLEAIEGAETANLTPSKAGFSLSKDGRPNMVFGVRDGKLAIQGINY